MRTRELILNEILLEAIEVIRDFMQWHYHPTSESCYQCEQAKKFLGKATREIL